MSIHAVLDNPTVGSRYGTTVSAPVFRVLAQEVLEYLGVPHDQPLKTPLAKAPEETADDAPSENTGDLNAMFDQINNLPADDPLRAASAAAPIANADPAAAATDAPTALSAGQAPVT